MIRPKQGAVNSDTQKPSDSIVNNNNNNFSSTKDTVSL
jgi:hypothetical protein